ncbi:MAG: PIG-L family deacetylase [Flammeovirgaceae bacterium]
MIDIRKVFVYVLALMVPVQLFAQSKPTPTMNAAEIKAALKKTQVLGTVLYMAAHPDDENTRFIAYAAKGLGLKTGYLSLTRGDGGQNLVGKEVRELLGVIRTQELLAARRTDGGQQFFTRANDFGYSKHPDETFNIWNREEVLADAVWTIRKFRPDVIVTRFSPNRAGRTHGHHTASAILAIEAAKAAADKSQFPEQLKYVEVWAPKRVVWNTSQWFFRRTNEKYDMTDWIKLDVGKYNPLLGVSYNEIASHSRTMHKSQGFGSRIMRGETIEYFSHLYGEKSTKDLFEGVDLTWNRVKGGAKVGKMLADISKSFDIENPAGSLPALTKALKTLRKMKKEAWAVSKAKELEEIILQCAGIWFENLNSDYYVVAGDSLQLSTNVIKRSNYPVTWKEIELPFQKIRLDSTLGFNKYKTYKTATVLPKDFAISQHYWLVEAASKGMYKVDDQQLIGKPENDFTLPLKATFEIDGLEIQAETPTFFKWTDPVKGELYRPLEVAPKVTANIDQTVMLFAKDDAQEVNVLLKGHQANLKGEVMLNCPEGWKVEPKAISFDLKEKYEERKLHFKLFPPNEQSVGEISASVVIGSNRFSQRLTTIEYDHIPTQTLFPQSSAKVVRLAIQRKGQKIGYIMGAGDAIPESLTQIGYQVDLLADKDITVENLAQYDAVIAGVRAYNTNKRMKFHQTALMEYVENGGNYIVQYNTSFRLATKDIGPYPLKLSRDRVTVEEAPITFLNEDHAILNYPNKITKTDFDGWVQERGLYFPSEWNEGYEAILACNDPGEDVKKGSLLVAHYGKGSFIYTGLSMFRELPAGVPGAYRLFVNMIDYENKEVEK